MSKLTTRPDGATYRERLLRHLERERVAKRWLQYLVEGLHIILLGSIGLFMTGLLYQLRNLAGSFDEDAPRLLMTWKVGLSLASVILLVVAASTMHAVIFEVSPFGGPFSKLPIKIAETCRSFFVSAIKWSQNENGKFRKWLEAHIAPSWMSWDNVLLGLLLSTTVPMWVPCLAIFWLRVKFDTADKEKLVGAFMDLMAEASDPKLVERAVGSFSYVEWFKKKKGTTADAADRLKKTWNRLMATDTSLRVRETLRARMTQFLKYHQEKSSEIPQEQIKALARVCPLVDRFTAEVYFTSCQADNADLRGLSFLPFEECIARILCSYNHEGNLGDRTEIFHSAEEHCRDLLREGKIDDVTRILSHVDPLDIIKSYIQYPDLIYYPVVEFIVRDREHEILRGMNQFVNTVDQSRLSPSSLSSVFSVLASPLPTDIDLSPIVDYISRHPYRGFWSKLSAAIIAFLTSSPLSEVSDSAAVRRFLELCLDPNARDAYGEDLWVSDYARDRPRIRRVAQTLLDGTSPSSFHSSSLTS